MPQETGDRLLLKTIRRLAKRDMFLDYDPATKLWAVMMWGPGDMPRFIGSHLNWKLLAAWALENANNLVVDGDADNRTVTEDELDVRACILAVLDRRVRAWLPNKGIRVAGFTSEAGGDDWEWPFMVGVQVTEWDDCEAYALCDAASAGPIEQADFLFEQIQTDFRAQGFGPMRGVKA